MFHDAPVLVIGIGSELRRDDAAGRAVVTALESAELGPAVEFVSSVQLLPEHAAMIARARRVIIVDAAHHLAPGATTRTYIAPSQSATDAHRLDAPGVVRLAHQAFGRAAPTELVCIGGADWGLGEGLSPLVTSGIAGLVPALVQELREAAFDA